MSHTTLSPFLFTTMLYLTSLLMTSSSSMQQSDVDSRLCSSLCQCTSSTVDCNRQDNLPFIPSKISNDYDQLHISHASFDNTGLSRLNFSSITFLRSLKIVYSSLDSLDDSTFILMTRLQYLDISYNRFTTISSRAFYGLSLTFLYLELNQGGLQISENMFQGLKVTNLHLRSNRISELPVTPFESLEIAKLYLFNNSITTIDRRFERIFSASDRLLDLTKNPLQCSCRLSWFPELIRKWQFVPQFVKITCHSPTYLQDSLVSTLSHDKFPCDTPSISRISVDVSDSYLQLVCHAKGNTSPQISWTQLNPETGSEMSNSKTMTSLNHQTYVAINISNIKNDNSFICRTWNEINSSNQVLVKLKLVDDFFSKLKKSPPPAIIRNDENLKPQLPGHSNPLPETHFLFTKQFSILQMIGAVVGTFTSVIVLIFVICCSQEHLMKKNSNANMYWTTIPPDSKSTYNRVINQVPNIPPNIVMVTSSNSQEYDIPQFHESNNFLQGYYTDRGVPHYNDVPAANYFSTAT